MKPADFRELRFLARADARVRVSVGAQCQGKHRYSTFGEADKRLRGDLRKEAQVYHCRYCQGFHVGSVDGRRQSRLMVKRRRQACDWQ